MTPNPKHLPVNRPPAKLFAWYVGVAERNTGKLLALLAAIMFVSLAFASRLELHTDLAELLPPKHPAVLALRRIAGRQKSATNLVMLIHSPSAEANHRFAEALAPALRDAWCRPRSPRSSGSPTPRSPSSARKWKWLYADDKELDVGRVAARPHHRQARRSPASSISRAIPTRS